MGTKLEINVRTLIVQCEDLAKDDTNNWLLKKYIKSLDTMINELEQCDEKPKAAAVDEYKSRCKALKEVTNYVEPPKLNSGSLKMKSSLDAGNQIVKEMNQIQDSKYANSLRRDLLGGGNANLRQRVNISANSSSGGGGGGGGGSDSNSTGDMSQAMKHHANMQEKIAEDMLALTKNLKEQTEIANRIIRKDTEVVSKSANLSETNYAALSKEATILKDHSKRACKCWMWIMIGIVMIVFIFMVLFMKIMKKRTS